MNLFIFLPPLNLSKVTLKVPSFQICHSPTFSGGSRGRGEREPCQPDTFAPEMRLEDSLGVGGGCSSSFLSPSNVGHPERKCVLGRIDELALSFSFHSEESKAPGTPR